MSERSAVAERAGVDARRDVAAPTTVAARAGPWHTRPGRLRCAVGGAVVVLLLAVAALAPLLAPASPDSQDLLRRLTPPAWMPGGSAANVLGTDHLGRDILSRIVHGARISAIVGVVAVLVSGVLGTTLGLVAGYYGARVDLVVMKLVELFLTIPFVLLALVVMALFGQGLAILIVVLCLNRWIHYARVVRGDVLSLREREFVAGARALGASNARIIARHVLPNTVASLSVVTTFSLATIILIEASLSFLGLGVPPTTPTWGGMLNESRSYMMPSWWTSVFPGLAIFVTVLGVNLLGDGVRDAFDPRLKKKA
ncbi:MAG TPA: ABC transporter permease [Methylomirabilota bacterium]|nr:ABC transporter permease [Methylomirabilota bacterium]